MGILWIVTAAGAVAGLALMSPILHAPDVLTTAFPQRLSVIGAAFLWLINDFGILAYGLQLPYAAFSLFGVDASPGTLLSMIAIPVALWEIILMPVWLFVKGFNTAGISGGQIAVSKKMAAQLA